MKRAIILTISWLMLGGIFSSSQEIGLPKRMGDINDYGNILGSSRKELQEKIDELKKGFNIELIILITLRDPYDDPDLYAKRIGEAWGLKGNRIIFALYIKEGDKWSALLKPSPDLQETFNQESLGLLKQRIDDKIKKRKIREAVVDTVSSISALAAGEEEKAAKVDGKRSKLAFYALLGIAAAGLLPIIMRALLVRACPRCGRRLRMRASAPLAGLYRRVRYILYYCPKCGYSKVDKIERKGEG